MVRLPLVASLVLLFPVIAVAQGPGQPVVGITGVLSNPRPVHGETVALNVTVTNDGPGSVTNVFWEVEVLGGLILGANCGVPSSPQYDSRTACIVDELAAGGRVAYRVDVQVSNSASTVSLLGDISTFTYGKQVEGSPTALEFRIDAPIGRASSVADLAVTASEEPYPISLSSPIQYVTTIANLGPDGVMGVQLIADDPLFSGHSPSNVSGADCRMVNAHTICDVGTIPPAGTATIRYTRDGSNSQSQETRALSVIASRSFDPVAANSSLERTVLVGIPTDLTRVLLPIVIPPTDGAFGSRWISEVSLFIDGKDGLFVFPTSYPCQTLCPPIQLSGATAPPARFWTPPLIRSAERNGYLLRFDKSRAHEVSFTARIRDSSRALDTWGTAIPVVTDDELLKGRLQLIDIAAGSRFRQTLRIYELDATDATVRVRVWGDTGTDTLLGEETVVLATPPYNHTTANAGLPAWPGYAQLDFASRFPAATQYNRLRVEIEPLSETTRYWAFVSITNNETQHVTLVTPETGGAQ